MKRIILLVSGLLLLALSWAKGPLNYYANKAEEAMSMARYEDALDYARQEINDYENNPNGYYQAGLVLYALNQSGQALSMINKAIENSKKNKAFAAQCYLAKAEMLSEIGDSVQALHALDAGLKIDGKNVDLLVERVVYLVGTDNKRALKDLQKVKKLSPEDPRGYVYTAYVYTTENKAKEALDEITRAIAIDNTMSYSYGLRGMILQQLGHTPDWIRDCLKSYELDNESSVGASVLASVEDENIRKQIIDEIECGRTSSNGYYILEANLLYAWNQLAPAAKAYQEIIDLGLADSITFYMLSYCQERLGFIIDAYATASNGLDLYPDDMALKYMKVQIGVTVGKGAEILGTINSLIAESPETAALYVEKGRAYMSMGRYADAVEPFATAVILNPSALNKLYYGDALKLSENTTKANSEYNDILKKSEEEIAGEAQSPEYIYAMAYSGLGQTDNAVSAIKSLSKVSPEAEISFLPLVFARLGLKSEAISALRNFKEKNAWNPLFDLYSYNFHILHSEPSFVELLADNGIKTKFSETTRLLEYVPDNAFRSSGGTSLKEVMSLLDESPYDWVKAFNELCPIDMGIAGQIISVEFDERTQTVTYNCTANPAVFNFKLINNNPAYKEKKEDVFILTLISDSPKIVDAGLTYIYNFNDPDGSDQSSFVITPAKMRRLKTKAQSKDEVDRIILDFWLEEESLIFSEDPLVREATVTLDGKTVTYTYPTSEEDGVFTHIELFRTDMKNQLSNLLNDPSMRRRIEIYVRQGLTLRYVYKGQTSGRTVEIEFSPEELSNHIK